TVPSSNVVANALAGKADKAADGTDGELAALDGNGALIRSGFTVAESVGGGSDNMVPTTEAVRQHVFSMLDEALNGSDDGAPSLFVRLNTQTGKYQLVYEDSDDVLHVLFDFGLLPSGGTDNYNDLSNKPQIEGTTLSNNKTAAELGLQKTISTPDDYLQIYANGQLGFSSGLVIKNDDIIPASRWRSGAMQVVNTQNDLTHYQQYLPQNCGFGLYIRMGSMPVSEYYFADSGKIYVQTADYQGSWIVSGWREISGGSQIVSGVVNQNGTITFTDSDGNTFTTTGSSVIGPQGAPGNDYVLTAQDKADIADIVLQSLPTTQGVLYGNANN
ncbi:MAG: hypothetical protein II513_08840, partial [Ruminococcus sp.]|nr:hypothetical protein [Ruminococcus sp.]